MRMRVVVLVAKYLRGKPSVFTSGQLCWPLVNTLVSRPVLPRKYLAIAMAVRMRVVWDAYLVFFLYIPPIVHRWCRRYCIAFRVRG